MFLGLEHATDRDGTTRAVLEGVSFAVRDCRDTLAETGTQRGSLIATGGGARSEYWLHVIATALGPTVPVPRTGKLGAAFETARLGMIAALGAGADMLGKPLIKREIFPTKDLSPAFDEGFSRFKAAQAATRGLI